jgi:hypothetical protein
MQVFAIACVRGSGYPPVLEEVLIVLSSIRWAKQLIHDYVILSGQHCLRLSAKMQPRLVNGSTVLANTNALDEKSARTGDAFRAPAPAPLTGNGVASRSPEDPVSSFRLPSS